jgi:prophage regulatory protein
MAIANSVWQLPQLNRLFKDIAPTCCTSRQLPPHGDKGEQAMNILRLPEIKRVLGHRADASVYNAIRAGLFTTGVAIGQRAKGWPDYEAQAIAVARVAGKSDAEIRELVKVLHAKRTELATA